MISIQTSAEFARARHTLGFSVSQCAKLCKVDDRTVRRWENGDRDPAPSACRLLELALAGHFTPKLWKELLS